MYNPLNPTIPNMKWGYPGWFMHPHSNRLSTLTSRKGGVTGIILTYVAGI